MMSLEMLTVLLDILIIAIIFIGGLFTKHYLPTYMDRLKIPRAYLSVF